MSRGVALGVLPLVVAAAGGAYGGFTQGGWGAALGGLVCEGLGLIGGVMVDRRGQQSDKRLAALEARGAVLDDLIPGPPESAETSVFEMLSAVSCPTRFYSRRGELSRLFAWCDAQDNHPVMVLEGPSGVGKTRLALQAARSLGENWSVGWLHPDAGAEAIASVTACGQPTLILVDDADTRPDLIPLLTSLATQRTNSGESVRLLLIARSGEGLRATVRHRLEERHRWVIDRAGLLKLEPLGAMSDLIRWYGEASEVFAHARQRTAPATSNTIGPVKLGQSLLEVFAQALADVLAGAQGYAEPRPLNEIAAVLFDHEQRWWERTIAQPRYGITDLTTPILTRIMVALLLLGTWDELETVAVLRRLPELADASSERLRNIARWATTLYPTEGAGLPIGPGLLADWFLTTRLADDAELRTALLSNLNEAQIGRVIAHLARASDTYEFAGELFEVLLGGDPVRRARYALHAALNGTDRHRLDQQTARALEKAEFDLTTLDQLEQVLFMRYLPFCNLALLQQRLQHARDNDETVAIATALTDLGHAFCEVGRPVDFLTAAEEAVGLWRTFAADNPAHQPDLACALATLGSALHEVGRLNETLCIAEETVGLWRTLAADNPAHQPDLARALAANGHALHWVGRPADFLAASEEAVDLWRTLAADDLAYRPELAHELDNLGIALRMRGHPNESLSIAEEAVRLWRTLAVKVPAFRPELAHVLDNFGIALREAGRLKESLDAAKEAVSLLRTLATRTPATRPNLATALDNLGMALRSAGRPTESLTTAEEAVGLWRTLAADNPAHEPGLAIALANLGIALRSAGRPTESLTTAEQAVGLWRTLAADNPAHQFHLAIALTNLGNALRSAGHPDDSITTAEEAVGLSRTLAVNNPTHEPGLAIALANLGDALYAVDRVTDSLTAVEEAVGLLRVLTANMPDRYDHMYKQALTFLRRIYDQVGKMSLAVSVDLMHSSHTNYA